ncbi:aspartic peptidase domain-containing protein [Russula vinacea]|nr:aspartic peptidase domain-containing protein [Russula vinacea]
MRLTPSFVLILGILFRITLNAYAIPLTREQMGVTPMRRDLHPQMLLQIHNARAQRRLARMTGRAVEEVDRLAVRGTARIGLPGAKLGSNNNLNTPSAEKASASDFAADTAGDGFSSADAQAPENSTLTIANTPTTANSLGLNIEGDDVGYIATIQMGTPPRDFKLLMDSGSADLWVGSEGCQSQGKSCVSRIQSSSSFVDTQSPFATTYGSGAVQGNIIQDTLAVGGLQLPGHTFGVAAEETDNFASPDNLFDGIMGVAQSTLSEQKTLTPVEALAKAGLIQKPIISFKIPRLADQKNDGEATLGDWTPANLTKTPCVSMNGVDLGLNNRTAILDTGTTLLLVPLADAQAIHNAIPGAKDNGELGFTVPCTTNASLTFTFGQQAFPIDSRDLAVTPVDPNNPSGDCTSGISAAQVGGPNQLLAGDVFLKNAYFSTNVEDNTIQLATLT